MRQTYPKSISYWEPDMSHWLICYQCEILRRKWEEFAKINTIWRWRLAIKLFCKNILHMKKAGLCPPSDFRLADWKMPLLNGTLRGSRARTDGVQVTEHENRHHLQYSDVLEACPCGSSTCNTHWGVVLITSSDLICDTILSLSFHYFLSSQ